MSSCVARWLLPIMCVPMATLLASADQPGRTFPPDYPDAAKPIDARRPGVKTNALPKNPPPLRLEGSRGERWPVTISGPDGAAAGTYAIEVWATNQPHVMAMAFIPDGHALAGQMLVADRRGTVRLLAHDRADVSGGVVGDGPREGGRVVVSVPDVYFEGDCGLMSMALHPKFAENGWVYLYYGDKVAKDCRIVRYRLDANAQGGPQLVDPKVIFSGIPLHYFHAAGTLRFGPDGRLYATTGDCWKMDTAQDPMHLGGKVLRLTDEGGVPADNPFVKTPGHHPALLAIGSRNSQGLDWQPGTNRLFNTEHGPSGEKLAEGMSRGGADELNWINAGANLGWPLITGEAKREGLVSPLLAFMNVVAPGSAHFHRGTATPTLTGSLLIGCMRGHALARVVISDDPKIDPRVLDWHTITDELGRIRALTDGPLDFSQPNAPSNSVLYFASSNTDRYGSRQNPGPLEDRIYRIVPASLGAAGK